jgi:hypothetical protein
MIFVFLAKFTWAIMRPLSKENAMFGKTLATVAATAITVVAIEYGTVMIHLTMKNRRIAKMMKSYNEEQEQTTEEN